MTATTPYESLATQNKPWSKSYWQTIRTWEVKHGRKWSSEREDSQVADNFRQSWATLSALQRYYPSGAVAPCDAVLDGSQKMSVIMPQGFTEEGNFYTRASQSVLKFLLAAITMIHPPPYDIEAVIKKMLK